MGKRQNFTAEDLERMGMMEIEPGVYQRLHTPMMRHKFTPVTKAQAEEAAKKPPLYGPAFDLRTYANVPELYVFDIIPMGKPRMNASDFFPGKKQRPIAIRYFAWCDELRRLAGDQSYVISERMDIIFYLPISNARRKKGIKDGDPCKDKPDYDNMLKAFNDALTSKRYAKRSTAGDQHIWDVRVRKYYSDRPRIQVKPVQD